MHFIFVTFEVLNASDKVRVAKAEQPLNIYCMYSTLEVSNLLGNTSEVRAVQSLNM